MTSEAYNAAKEIANNLSSKRSADVSEYQIAQETLNHLNSFYKNCAKLKLSGRKGLSQIEKDNVYKILVEKQHGNNISAAFNILMDVQGIQAYGLMYTDRGNHSGASLVSLDGELYICDILEEAIYSLDQIPKTWNLIGEYGNIELIAFIMGESIDSANLGKEDMIEASDGDLRIYVDYISSDSDGTDNYVITAQDINNASFSKYILKYGIGSQIVIKENISVQELKNGVNVSVDKATKSKINVKNESNAFFLQGMQ